MIEILHYSLHKTDKVLKEMQNDSRINKDYLHYAQSIKWDIECILNN